MSEMSARREPLRSPDLLRRELEESLRLVFDLDGTLYDTRDFERAALAAVADWLEMHSGQPLDGFREALWQHRETDRHRRGLFDRTLVQFGLPAAWGVECARRFRTYAGTELSQAPSLRNLLLELRARRISLALVSNGHPDLQARKLALLGLRELFDVCIICDPARPDRLKPGQWAWTQLEAWRAQEAVTYVGDDSVDAEFAQNGQARFVHYTFRNPRYGD